MAHRLPRALLCSSLLILAGCARSAQFAKTAPKPAMPGHTVYISPITLNTAKVQDGLTTQAELTALLAQELQHYGIQVADRHGPSVTETLICSVPELGYTTRRRYPRRLMYRASLTCSLVDPSTKDSVWERTLDQHFDDAVLLNTMTKLPEHHDPLLWRECISPVWDGMAAGVRMYFERPQIATQTVEPMVADEPPQQSEPVPNLQYLK